MTHNVTPLIPAQLARVNFLLEFWTDSVRYWRLQAEHCKASEIKKCRATLDRSKENLRTTIQLTHSLLTLTKVDNYDY